MIEGIAQWNNQRIGALNTTKSIVIWNEFLGAFEERESKCGKFSQRLARDDCSLSKLNVPNRVLLNPLLLEAQVVQR